MDGFVLDVHADPARREMVTWIKTARGAVPLRERYAPTFHVRPRAADDAAWRRLAEGLRSLRGVAGVADETHRLGLDDAPRRVLAVSVRDLDRVVQVAESVDAWGGYRDLDLYDVDLRLSTRFLVAKGVFPFARVRAFANGSLRLRDAQWADEYETPALTRAALDATVEASGAAPTVDDPLRAARLDEAVVEGSEEEVLLGLARLVAERDPDILVTKGGDTFLLPYLEERARRLGLQGWTVGREPGARTAGRGKSFVTYGKVKYRPPAHPLRGRVHVDADASFFWGEGGLEGLVDLARISGIPLQELARLEAGTAVTAIQVDRAKREGRLVPWKKNAPEVPKTLRELVAADRGGYIFDPVVGVHEDVYELDFSSLYPSIIATRNLSPETVLCSCCDARDADHPTDRVVPQTGYVVCRRKTGLVPKALGDLVRRRTRLKKMRKAAPPEARPALTARVDALKWLCVVSFGYQGYRNARFGRIECHEATCAWGREILLTASEVARAEGFELLHGIVDSLWVKRTRPGADVDALGAAVTREVGIEFEPQGRYKWIVFLPNRASLVDANGVHATRPSGALNRYYGCLDKVPDAPNRSQAGQEVDYLAGGALKVRGVELRQSSVCPFVVRVQEAVLNALAPAEDAREFHARVPRALDAARPLFDKLREGRVAPDDLFIAARISQPLDAYRARTHARAALAQLARRGVEVHPGESVRYVVLREHARSDDARVREARLWRGEVGYDRAFYARLAARAVESLLLPAGVRAASLAPRAVADLYAARPPA